MKHFLVIMSVAALGLCGCDTAGTNDVDDTDTTTLPTTDETPATDVDTGTGAATGTPATTPAP